MAITNSTCIKQCNCTTITVTDTSDWDTLVPATDIVSSVFVLTYTEDNTSNTISADEYLNSADFTFTPTAKDGEYQVLITYTDTEDEVYEIEEYFYNVCNIKCKIDKVIKDITAENECNSCKDDAIKLAVEAYILFKALCAAIICKNTSEADKLLAWLNDKLINYKCKSC